MATSDASRSSSSSGGSADSYIGSLISLISKSEIRYEGLLFNVNTSESSIRLKNVRSFGTEGRKKDGPQVPPGDKVYEYILFRGTDIKDLQVKSSPPVQPTAPIYNDPAIIQSRYPQVTATSMSLPSTVTGSPQHLSSQTSPVELPKSTFQGNLPLYQPSETSGSWGLSHPFPTINSSQLNMPVYMQGFYGPSNGLQTQPQSLLQPPLALSVPPSLPQTVQYPNMSAPLPNRPSNLPASQLYSSTLPLQSSSVAVDSSTTTMSVMAPTRAISSSALSTSMPFVFPLTTVSEKSSCSNVSEPEASFARTSSSFVNKGSTSVPSLVTPNQIMQPGRTTTSSSPSLQSAQEVEVVQKSSPELLPTLTEAQAPILPLPSSSDCKVGGHHPHTRHNNRGGRERVRGTGASHKVTRFTEDFDFNAMNEKFNKDEVWGHFGRNNTTRESGCDDSQDEDKAGTSKVEIKPFYVKDDFFDSLSCNAFDNGPRNGRAKFSEQMKVDAETFGNFMRHPGGRGGRGFGHGGRGFGRGGRGHGHSGFGYDRGGGHSPSGAYNGRSYNYNGRGWGHHTT